MKKHKRTRLSANHRAAQILRKAIELAEQGQLYNMTADQIAKSLHISHGTVFHYFNSMLQLRGKVIERSIARENYKIIRQAVVSHDPAVDNCPASIKEKSLESFKDE